MQGTQLKAWQRMLLAWTAEAGPVTQIIKVGHPDGQPGTYAMHYWLGDNTDPVAPDLVLTAQAVGAAGFHE